LASTDTVVIGGYTHSELLNMDVIWSYPEQTTYIVYRHDWGTKENVRFITENIIETISELPNQEGKDILLVGSGELISMLLVADTIDVMLISYIPVIPDKYIPLFSARPKELKWELIHSKPYKSGVLIAEYRKSKSTY
jgi:dihydrofolate reductase